MYLYMEDAAFTHQFIDGRIYIVDVLVESLIARCCYEHGLAYRRVALDLAPAGAKTVCGASLSGQVAQVKNQLQYKTCDAGLPLKRPARLSQSDAR